MLKRDMAEIAGIFVLPAHNGQTEKEMLVEALDFALKALNVHVRQGFGQDLTITQTEPEGGGL